LLKNRLLYNKSNRQKKNKRQPFAEKDSTAPHFPMPGNPLSAARENGKNPLLCRGSGPKRSALMKHGDADGIVAETDKTVVQCYHRLIRSHPKLESVINAMPSMALVLNRAHQIVYGNRAFLSVALGHPADSVSNHHSYKMTDISS